MDVENHLVNGDATTIHWHGMYQRGTQWMDGVPMLTQCPIEESASLQYTFVAQPAGIFMSLSRTVVLKLIFKLCTFDSWKPISVHTRLSSVIMFQGKLLIL